MACEYIQKYPDREEKETHLERNVGYVNRKDDFIIVRGKNPKAKGVKGSYIFLLKEKKGSREIEQIQAAYIDDIEIKADQYYGLRGDAICKKKC